LTLFSLTVLAFTTLVLCYQMLRVSNSPAKLLFYGALLFFVFSCVWIYAEMHENAKAENSARLEQYEIEPRDCDYQNFTYWELPSYFIRVKLLKCESRKQYLYNTIQYLYNMSQGIGVES